MKNMKKNMKIKNIFYPDKYRNKFVFIQIKSRIKIFDVFG